MPMWWTQTLSDAMGKARTSEFKLLFLRFPVPSGLLSVTDDCLQHYPFLDPLISSCCYSHWASWHGLRDIGTIKEQRSFSSAVLTLAPVHVDLGRCMYPAQTQVAWIHSWTVLNLAQAKRRQRSGPIFLSVRMWIFPACTDGDGLKLKAGW